MCASLMDFIFSPGIQPYLVIDIAYMFYDGGQGQVGGGRGALYMRQRFRLMWAHTHTPSDLWSFLGTV